MKISLTKDVYVVAVSGGVDSVVLLDLVRQINGAALIVAHVDHGIRGAESQKDAEFVHSLAEKYGLSYESIELHLGPSASEAEARKKRYQFLESVREKHQAAAILTAHHQDDVIETAIINLLRGTHNRGLSALKNQPTIRRPLLDFSKQEILVYANEHKLNWCEDHTNQDTTYLRNFVRHTIVEPMSSAQRQKWLDIITQSNDINVEIEMNLLDLSGEHYRPDKNTVYIERAWYIMLPSALRKEILARAIRQSSGEGKYSTPQLTYLDLLARTAQKGSHHPIGARAELQIQDAKVLVKAKTL